MKKTKIYTFYWTTELETKQPVSVLAGNGIEAAFDASHVMAVQKDMLNALIERMVARLLIEDGNYEVIEYAYSEPRKKRKKKKNKKNSKSKPKPKPPIIVQECVYQDFVDAALKDKSTRYIFVAPPSKIGRGVKMKTPKKMFDDFKKDYPQLFMPAPDRAETEVHTAAYDLDETQTIDRPKFFKAMEEAYKETKKFRTKRKAMRASHSKQRTKLKAEVVANPMGFPQAARIKGGATTAKASADYAAKLKAEIERIVREKTSSHRKLDWAYIAKELTKEKFPDHRGQIIEWNSSSLRSRAARKTIPSMNELKELSRKRGD